MSKLVKKHDLVISIGIYNDQQGNPKNQYKTIGELVTMRDDQGQTYSFGKLWGPGGVAEFKLFEKDLNRATNTMKEAPPKKDDFDDDIPF